MLFEENCLSMTKSSSKDGNNNLMEIFDHMRGVKIVLAMKKETGMRYKTLIGVLDIIILVQ